MIQTFELQTLHMSALNRLGENSWHPDVAVKHMWFIVSLQGKTQSLFSISRHPDVAVKHIWLLVSPWGKTQISFSISRHPGVAVKSAESNLIRCFSLGKGTKVAHSLWAFRCCWEARLIHYFLCGKGTSVTFSWYPDVSIIEFDSLCPIGPGTKVYGLSNHETYSRFFLGSAFSNVWNLSLSSNFYYVLHNKYTVLKYNIKNSWTSIRTLNG